MGGKGRGGRKEGILTGGFELVASEGTGFTAEFFAAGEKKGKRGIAAELN